MSDKDKELLSFIKAQLQLDNPNTITTLIDEETGLPEKISFSDFGQPWIDKIIARCLPGVKVASPMFASYLYGNYFREFDEWRASEALGDLSSHQGVLTFGKDFRTSCLRLAARDSMTDWYGKSFDGETVGFFCIDRNLVLEISQSFFELVAPGYSSNIAARNWIKKLSPDKPGPGGPDYEKLKASIEPARAMFAQTCVDLQRIFGASEATEVLARFIGSRNLPLSNDDENWIWSYCESTVIHFIMGHEFGHYIFSKSQHPYTQNIAHITRAVMVEYPNEGIFEEAFCDVVGLENCFFQMNFFAVPPAFTLAVTAWTLAITERLAKDLHGVADQGLRLQAWASYWQHIADNDDKYSGLSFAALPMLNALRPLSESVVTQLTNQIKPAS